jgi:hypothetical protein
MATRSVTYLFQRDGSLSGFMSRNEPATDAEGVVMKWAAVEGRTFQTLLDQEEIYIAHLTYDEDRQQEAADDLNRLCSDKGIKRSLITEEQVAEMRK